MHPIAFRPPRIALFLLAVSLLLHWLLSGLEPVRFSAPWLGAVLVIAGFGIMTWGWWIFRKENVAICPTAETARLVCSGPFRFSRNPMYLGIVLMLLGTAALIGTLPMLLAPVAFWATMDRVFIPYEEAKLERTFGAEYLDYKSRVRRWL